METSMIILNLNIKVIEPKEQLYVQNMGNLANLPNIIKEDMVAMSVDVSIFQNFSENH